MTIVLCHPTGDKMFKVFFSSKNNTITFTPIFEIVRMKTFCIRCSKTRPWRLRPNSEQRKGNKSRSHQGHAPCAFANVLFRIILKCLPYGSFVPGANGSYTFLETVVQGHDSLTYSRCLFHNFVLGFARRLPAASGNMSPTQHVRIRDSTRDDSGNRNR